MGEVCVRNVGGLEGIYMKRGVEKPLMGSKKRVNTSFLSNAPAKTFAKRFLCGADHRPKEYDAVRII